MKLTTLFTFCFLQGISFYKSATAQFNYMPASVWFSNSDTLIGSIDNQDMGRYHSWIQFHQEHKEPNDVLNIPINVKGQKSEKSKSRLSFVGKVDSAHIIIQKKLSSKQIPSQIIDTLFMDALETGHINLFYGVDKRRIPHFFLQNGSALLEELHYYKFIAYETGANHGVYNSVIIHSIDKKIYKQQMMAAFADCMPIYEKLATANLPFTRRSLMKWVRDYNEYRRGSEVNAASSQPSETHKIKESR